MTVSNTTTLDSLALSGQIHESMQVSTRIAGASASAIEACIRGSSHGLSLNGQVMDTAHCSTTTSEGGEGYMHASSLDLSRNRCGSVETAENNIVASGGGRISFNSGKNGCGSKDMTQNKITWCSDTTRGLDVSGSSGLGSCDEDEIEQMDAEQMSAESNHADPGSFDDHKTQDNQTNESLLPPQPDVDLQELSDIEGYEGCNGVHSGFGRGNIR
ncbi:hypothetical protein L208DRAFT_1553574 [Tricholoma matsutake]|nr:hypothetical protein L208DRAFT_1553574 [Tricholoma matsutake 945]